VITGLTLRNFKGVQSLYASPGAGPPVAVLGERPALPLSRFQVLVGPNGVGKTTVLDAIDFVCDCLTYGPGFAVELRGIADFKDMTWLRKGGPIKIDLWLDLAAELPTLAESILLYRLAVRQDDKLGVCVEEEALRQFSRAWLPKSGMLTFKPGVKPKRLLGKTSKGTDFYSREKGSYQDSFNFGLDKLTLALTPPDEDRYPTANAVRRFLMQGVRYIQLNSRAMRLPCPATRGTNLDLDGTNIARVVGRLLDRNGAPGTQWAEPGTAVARWVEHLRYALPDLVNIGWDRRQADNAEFLVLRYENGLEAPSWILSDGTLRMLALTLPAFLPPESALYMVEEPENGVYPKALEIILRSLSKIPGGQMLLATHSPFVVQHCGIESLLCFSRDEHGTHIIPGPAHPALKDWDGTPDLGIVFAAGLLE